MTSVVYADYNATTPIDPEVFDAMRPYLTVQFGNASSPHAYGRQAALALEQARSRVAEFIDARPGAIVFTSGGTESNHLALLGTGRKAGRIVTSAVEHPSVFGPARRLEEAGWRWDVLPVDRSGRIDLSRAEEMLRTPADIVSVILAQNEVGVIQPVAEIAELARAASPGVFVHTDAAQAVGKIPVSVRKLRVDAMTVVSHKLYGPKGVGALYVAGGAVRRPLFVGGGQEGGARPGTEPVAALVGFGCACERAGRLLQDEMERTAGLCDRLWLELSRRVPGVRRTVPPEASILPNTLHLLFPGCDATDLLAAAPGVAASVGAACHAGAKGISGVLTAMGIAPEEARGAVRLSLGRFSTVAEVDRIAKDLADAYVSLCRS